jgi:hypothetical protein
MLGAPKYTVNRTQATDRPAGRAKGRIKGLLLDTANLKAVAVLSTVKHHDPSFNLPNVLEDVELSGLIRREDVVAAVGEVVKKFDFGID